MKTNWKATFIITLEGTGHHESNIVMTAQMARDKILAPVQEMWITRLIKKFTMEEVEPTKIKSIFARKNEKGERKSFAESPSKKRGGGKINRTLTDW